jgi:uncharacterized membrane protein required for colicin V production
MELDLLCLLVLAVFAALGAIRGTLRSGVRVGCWVFGYIGAVVFAPDVAPLLTRYAGLTSPFSFIAAGVGILILIWVLGAFVVRGVEKRFGAEGHREGMDGVGGALFGLVQGGLVVLLLGWLTLWLQAAERVGASLPFSPPSASFVAHVSGKVMGKGAELALGADEPAARVATRFAADPASTVDRVRSLAENPRIVALQRDPAFWSDVNRNALDNARNALDNALNRPSFLGIAYDDSLRHELAEVGLVGRGAALDARLFRNDVEDTLEEIAPKVRRLANSHELRAVSEDYAVRAALEAGDTVALLQNPRVQELIGRVLASETPPGAAAETRGY